MKKLFAILFILILPICVWGQSKETENLYKQGMQLYKAGEYELSVPYFLKCDSICKNLQSESVYLEKRVHKQLEKLVSNLCVSSNIIQPSHYKFNQNSSYKYVIRLYNLAMEIYDAIGIKDTMVYASYLEELADYNSKIGDYTEAIRVETIAMEIMYKNEAKDGYYAKKLGDLAYYYSIIDNLSEAIRLGTSAADIFRELPTIEGDGFDYSVEYGKSLTRLAEYYAKCENYTEAIKIGTLASKILSKETFPSSHYIESLINLADYNSKISNYSETLRLGTKAIKFGITNHHNFLRLADCLFETGQFDTVVNLYEQIFQKNFFVLSDLFKMTTEERSAYWNKIFPFLSDIIPNTTYTISQNSSLFKKTTYANITSLAFNGQVFSKQLLLGTEVELKKNNEQHESFTEEYKQFTDNFRIMDSLLQLPYSKKIKNKIDSIWSYQRHQILFDFELPMESFFDKYHNLLIDWRDIQNSLHKNDLVIEFMNFNERSTNQQIYIALVLKKGMKHPELVKLFIQDDFVAVKESQYYGTSILYNLIWKPLDNYLQGVQNVYFSPAGKFHTIGIEYLPDEKGEIFAKKFNAYRLSSTRELALNHTVNQNKKASVFGGIVYDFDESDWQNISEEEAERAGLTFLKGAKKESEEITQILSDSSFNVSYGTDKAATEESFKKLSGSGIKILHIATHGFYEPESKDNSFADMLSSGDKNSKEDLSLSRSGLFFAGANTALDPEQRQFIPDGVDDGILTAKEISRMDFKGLDLVVMSACQTGLGEVTSEGVFGLQRGFKKAGAQTIVMSLWNVSDKPTRELMTEFYRNLVSGKTKREAFILAQDKIRKKYIDPKMWAGFIMVDGIE